MLCVCRLQQVMGGTVCLAQAGRGLGGPCRPEASLMPSSRGLATAGPLRLALHRASHEPCYSFS